MGEFREMVKTIYTLYMYMHYKHYNIYIYIYIYKCHRQTIPSSEWRFSALSVDKLVRTRKCFLKPHIIFILYMYIYNKSSS